MSDLEGKLARGYISDAIRNSSASIKACWTIVFTAATIGALNPVTSAIRCQLHIADPNGTLIMARTTISESCRHFEGHYLFITIWMFLVYFTTFARFYLGGLRVFDIKYNEIFSLINAEILLLTNSNAADSEERHEIKERLEKSHQRFVNILDYNDNKRYKFEVFWLLLQSIIVVSLAYDIPTPRLFVETFGFLIFVNALYLYWSIWVSNMAITNLEHEIFPVWGPNACRKYPKEVRRALQAENLPNDAASKWAGNNIVHSIFIMLLFAAYDNPNIIVALSACSLNCVIDFALTKNFYFPKFSAKYHILINPPIVSKE